MRAKGSTRHLSRVVIRVACGELVGRHTRHLELKRHSHSHTCPDSYSTKSHHLVECDGCSSRTYEATGMMAFCRWWLGSNRGVRQTIGEWRMKVRGEIQTLGFSISEKDVDAVAAKSLKNKHHPSLISNVKPQAGTGGGIATVMENPTLLRSAQHRPKLPIYLQQSHSWKI